MTQATDSVPNRVVALCGGVGGAKLAFGLYKLLGANLTIVINSGDDFEHLGLAISPDLDTVLYTLAGISNRELGWGRADETWNFMETLQSLGGETWFRLGDRDLALHIERTRHLHAGRSLTDFTALAAARFGISATLLPMCDDSIRTIVLTTDGILPFQRYFVERRCEPVVRAVRFEGVGQARPSASVLSALQHSDLRAIIICPSNPHLSVDPILMAPGIRELLTATTIPIVAVSPLIGGTAVKGPTGKIFTELGIVPSTMAIAEHYSALIDGLVIDHADAADQSLVSCPTYVTATMMKSDEDRVRLAAEVLAYADRLAEASSI